MSIVPQPKNKSRPITSVEREFLRLAGNYLACRLEVMGGRVTHWWGYGPYNMELSLLGMHDTEQEMRLLLAERSRPGANQ
jgi:hypothetical protein